MTAMIAFISSSGSQASKARLPVPTSAANLEVIWLERMRANFLQYLQRVGAASD